MSQSAVLTGLIFGSALSCVDSRVTIRDHGVPLSDTPTQQSRDENDRLALRLRSVVDHTKRVIREEMARMV